jgi:hypothetical protein
MWHAAVAGRRLGGRRVLVRVWLHSISRIRSESEIKLSHDL